MTVANILVVDDTAVNLNILVTILEESGYQVRPAISGEFALQTARILIPDLILLDISMPDMDGYEVVAELQADEQLRHIPVIFISAHHNIDKEELIEIGVVDYIEKPFRLAEILEKVKLHINR